MQVNAKETKKAMTVMIRPSLRNSIEEAARLHDRSLGYMVEQAVAEYLQRRTPTNPSVHTTL
mgnify:CR=1 FL=1